MTKLILATLLFVSSNATADSCRSLNDFTWLLGKWKAQNTQALTTEVWHKLSENTFEGAGRTLDNYESLRLLAMSGEIFYLAKVSHNAVPIAFKLIECIDKSFTFENQLHDFPKQIEYQQISNNIMQITVSGKEESFSIQLHRNANAYNEK